jgi:hypothetical protein
MSARRPGRRRRWLSRVTVRITGLFVLVLVALVALTSAAPAATSSGQPSAADQYIEDIPTIGGSEPLNPGQAGAGGSGAPGRRGAGATFVGGGATPLSANAQRALRALGGPRARELRILATSTALGAPRAAGGRTRGRGGSVASGAVVATATPRGGSTGVLVWLVIALVAMTVIGIVMAGHDRRQRREAGS